MVNSELERKVKERTEKIERLLQQKNEFINQLGHDLKTPLVPFVILTPMLKKHLAGKPKILKIVDTLESSTNHIKNMVDKTLQLAKLNSSKVTFEFEETNLVSEINDAIENNQYLFNENNIDVKNMVDEEIIVNADKSQLEEVFTNLFTNAIKYSQDNKGNIVIDVKKGKDDDEVIVSVKDDGIGMTSEQQEHIFDEFYKIDSSRHDLDSSGLGLAICKRIVEYHGGKMWVDSPGVGKGSAFYFTLKTGGKKDE
jgi:signal transduction histidine kinase